MRKQFLFLLSMLIITSSLSARDTIRLNSNWDFAYGFEVLKSKWQRVEIPHTWNRVDAHERIDYYRGQATYMKKLAVKNEWKGKRLFLKFNGVNTVSNVFINGIHVGEHRGGYTAFVYEITDRVTYGEENEIMVRVSNALQLDVMPLLGDFNFYGGIYRDVQLIVTEETCISPLQYASSGVYLAQNSVTKAEAKVGAKVIINTLQPQSNYKVQLNIYNGKALVLSETKEVSPSNAGNSEITLPLVIKNPRLWNGQKDPFIYNVEVSLFKDNVIQDQVTQPLGLRYYHVDANQGFFLNGEHLQLRGVCRHQDWSEVGNALHPEHHEKDIEIMTEMGANAVRLSHYPQDHYFYELLDKGGFFTWSEIPFVGPGGYRDQGFVNQPSFRENGKLQLTEMIHQYYNHPSIMVWGLFNELKMTGDNPHEYIKELNDLAHQLDPTRLTVSASNIDGAINGVTDLIGWNKYYGWYEGEPKEIGVWADTLHKGTPAYNICVSEYGAGASIYHHEEQIAKPVPVSYWHPEAWQTHYHMENWKAINERPFIWGSFIWNLFDFGASHRTEGDRDCRNDKGLVTYDRQVKKDSWWFYKANWNKTEPVLYIANRRFNHRTEGKTKVMVFTNASQVELFVNNVSMGVKKADNYATILWENIQLQEGNNQVKVISRDKKSTLEDNCSWYLE